MSWSYWSIFRSTHSPNRSNHLGSPLARRERVRSYKSTTATAAKAMAITASVFSVVHNIFGIIASPTYRRTKERGDCSPLAGRAELVLRLGQERLGGPGRVEALTPVSYTHLTLPTS